MQKKSSQPTFEDLAISSLGSPRKLAFFAELERHVPITEMAVKCEVIWENRKGPGRPHWPVETMLRVVLLQHFFNLSDLAAEMEIQDSAAFRHFLKLNVSDGAPDHSTIANFRARLVQHGLVDSLLNATLDNLAGKGLLTQKGTMIDATIIQAPRGRVGKDGQSTADPCAAATFKHNRPYFGFKGHIATNTDGVVMGYVFGPANEHDAKYFQQLLGQERKAVYTDSAYRSRQRVLELEQQGIYCGMAHRRVKGQGELTKRQREHNKRVARNRGIGELPFAFLANTGGKIARFRGLVKNGFYFGMKMVAYNLRRTLSLARTKVSCRNAERLPAALALA